MYQQTQVDLSDLIMYETEFDADASIDVGDDITIECLDGIYHSGVVYAYGKTYVRIIDNYNRVHTALITADVTLNLRLSDNQKWEYIYGIAERVQAAMGK